MSVDIISAIDTASSLAFLVILVLAAVRGVELLRALTSRIYRNRAFRIAALCVLIALQAQVPNSWAVGGLPIFELVFFIMISVFFAFIDSTISVALEVDFFHRNSLRWRQTRFIAYPIVYVWVTLFLITTYLSGLPNPPDWVSAVQNGPGGALFVATILYSIVALVIGARRSSDKTLRRHILLLALFFGMFIATTLMFNYTSTVSIDLLSDALTVLGAYVLYRAVMTLSPVGRIEKEAVSSVRGSEPYGQDQQANRLPFNHQYLTPQLPSSQRENAYNEWMLGQGTPSFESSRNQEPTGGQHN